MSDEINDEINEVLNNEITKILNKIYNKNPIDDTEIYTMLDLFMKKLKEITTDMDDIKEISSMQRDFIVFVHNSLKENQSETFNLLSEQSEIIDSIKYKLTDNEYLTLMNNFKKVNDSVNDINKIYDYIDENKLLKFLEEDDI